MADSPQTAAMMPTALAYGVLRQTHPEYAPDTWQEIRDLYAGGYQIAANARRYLPALAGENPARYEDRLSCTGYIGYLGQITDYFVASLFSQDLVVTEAPDAADPNTPGGKSDTKFYTAFAHDADLAGNSFAAVMRGAFRNAALLKRSVIAADFPSKPETTTIVTRADEDALGTNRAYVYEIPLEQIINWELDKQGNYAFAVIYTCETPQASPAVKRGSAIRHRFKVWTREADGTGAHWWLYEKVEQPQVEKFTDDTPIQLVDDGSTTFTVIPLVQIEVRAGLWIGNKLGPLAKEHYQRRSTLVTAQNASLLAIPVIKRGPEMSAIGQAIPSETQQNPRRGADPVGRTNSKGWVEIGSDDSLEFAEPSGKAYEIVDKQLKDLKDEMHRIVHQMAAAVDNKAGTSNRSGDSKRQDRAAEAIVLGQFGKDVREGARRVYDVIAGGRKERVVWVARGLDKFEVDTREALLAEAVQVALIPIPSKTWAQEYKTQLALQLVQNAPPETQDTIRQEILDGVEDEDKLRKLKSDAQKQQLQNPQPPAQQSTDTPPPPDKQTNGTADAA